MNSTITVGAGEFGEHFTLREYFFESGSGRCNACDDHNH